MIIPAPKPNKKFTYFVGIDVSRNKLDFAILEGKNFLFHREILNEIADISLFIFELKSVHYVTIAKTLFCFESTGIYGNHILKFLSHLNAYVVVEQPLRIKNSLGLSRGKTDKLDSIRIAKYAEKCAYELHLWQPKRFVIQKLALLMTLRRRQIKINKIARVPQKEQTTFIDQRLCDLTNALCSRSLAALQEDLLEIDRTIDLVIARDEHLNHLYELIISVPGIGRVTAIMIIVATNEFKTILDAKKFACYAGIAPFANDSGTIKRKAKISQHANKKIKTILHSCAISAIQNNQEIGDYYHRKTKIEGKAKMAAFNAVRNKLILRVFACVNQNRPFDPHYKIKSQIKEETGMP